MERRKEQYKGLHRTYIIFHHINNKEMSNSMYDIRNNEMSKEEKKDFVLKEALEMLEWSKDNMIKSIERAVKSGSIDFDTFDPNAKLVISKTIMLAVLENEAHQYKGVGTSLERKVRKNANNIKLFI
jgi:hypothetical protein